MKKQTLAVAMAALMTSFGAQAAIVDLFTTDQAYLVDKTLADGGLSSSVSGANILGGERDLYVELFQSNDPANRNASIGVSASWLNFSVDALANGTGWVQWDGADNSIALDPIGLGGVDLTDGGVLTHFKVDTIFSDQGYEFWVEAYSSATAWSRIKLLSHAVALPTTSFIPFAGFFACGLGPGVIPDVLGVECGAGGPVDLTHLGALQVKIDPNGGTTSVDLSLDNVTTVPEPGVLGLLGIGLVGLAAVSRRNRKPA